MCVGEAVRATRVDFKGCVFDEFGRSASRGVDRHDLIIVAVDDQGWYVELLEIFGEVRLGKRLDAVKFVLETALHGLEPECVADALANLSSRPVGTVEFRRKVLEELRTVSSNTGADAVERLYRCAAGIGVRLEPQRRHRAQQHGLGDATGCRGGRCSGQLHRRRSNGRPG